MACVTKRRDRYVLDFYDHVGRRQRKTLPKGTTKKRARQILREIEDHLELGTYLPAKRVPTFAQVAADWLSYKQPNLRPSTWVMYEGHIRNHMGEFSASKINRITTAKVEAFINACQTEEMSIATLRKLIVTLNQIMQFAVRHGYAPNNPVRDAERPKDQGSVERPKIRILKPGDVEALLACVKNFKYKTLFMLAITSGARQGELLGLKWTDIDWDNSQVHIQRTYNKRAFYRPKSRTSNRKIDLGPAMIATLKKWRLACPPSDLGLIFPSEKGQPLAEATMVRRYFKPALKSAGLPNIRFHDLRHTTASLLIAQGENIKYIQTQLGHSSPTVTLDVYAHLINPVNRESAARLENTIFATTGHKMVTKTDQGVTL